MRSQKKVPMQYSEKTRILVIEDDSHIAEGLKLNLTFQGYDVMIAPDGISGLQHTLMAATFTPLSQK